MPTVEEFDKLQRISFDLAPIGPKTHFEIDHSILSIPMAWALYGPCNIAYYDYNRV